MYLKIIKLVSMADAGKWSRERLSGREMPQTAFAAFRPAVAHSHRPAKSEHRGSSKTGLGIQDLGRTSALRK